MRGMISEGLSAMASDFSHGMARADTESGMSSIGSSTPAQISALQAAQAQQVASKSKDTEKAQAADSRRSLKDQVDLRVDGVETNTAVRKLPKQSTEQEREEHEANSQANGGKTRSAGAKKPPRIDLKA